MKKVKIEEGQISLWDMPQEAKKIDIKPQVNNKIIDLDIAKRICNLYKDNAIRILRLWGGRYSVELENKTIYFTSDGNEEYSTELKRSVIALDEILFAKLDKEVNKLQDDTLEKLKKEYEIYRVIKRFGDSSYIVITKDKKYFSINNKGWIIPYENYPCYKENEILNDSKESSNKKIEIGNTVEVEYMGKKYLGQVFRIYGPGNCTVNVIFEGKHTAFYKDKVKLVG